MKKNYDFTETEKFFNTAIEPEELVGEVLCIISEYAKLALSANDDCGTKHADNITTLDNICIMLNSIKSRTI